MRSTRTHPSWRAPRRCSLPGPGSPPTASSCVFRSSTCTASVLACSARWRRARPPWSSTASKSLRTSELRRRAPCSSVSPPCTTVSPRRGGPKLASLRLCVSGSAPLAADLWHRLAGAAVVVLERYGMTETLLTLSNPLVGERRARLGRRAAPRRGRSGRRRRRTRSGGAPGTRRLGVPRLLGVRDTLEPGDWFATGDLVSVRATTT